MRDFTVFAASTGNNESVEEGGELWVGECDCGNIVLLFEPIADFGSADHSVSQGKQIDHSLVGDIKNITQLAKDVVVGHGGKIKNKDTLVAENGVKKLAGAWGEG